MSWKIFRIPAFAVTLGLGVGACYNRPPPPAYGPEEEVEVESEPPAAQVEVRPVEPYGGAVWIEGRWAWRANRWAWVHGYWEHPRAGWAWVPHHWVPAGHHYRYVPGHWRRV